MEQRSSTSRYILTALAVILVITTFVLVGLNALNLQRYGLVPPGQQELDAKYKEGYLAAREKYQAMCPLLNAPLLNIVGTISEISDGTITVDAMNVGSDAIVDGMDSTRTVHLSDSTVIQKVTPKTGAELASELKTISTIDAKNPPPSPNTIKQLRSSDLKVGDTVTVATAEDARTTSDLTAITISVNPQ